MFGSMIKCFIPSAVAAIAFISGPADTVVPEVMKATLKGIEHPVSTKDPQAQKSFNKGLTYIFAYNHDLSFREFEKASQLDPTLAMAYWGMALTLGQNINQDVSSENELRAYNYIQKALALSSGATPVEQAYIKALAQRYTNDPSKNLISLRFDYRNAMKQVMKDYPEDLDAACLYAESILNLDPWRYWTWDGNPREGTLEAIDVLESLLLRDPYHVGGNHFYIHVWEASPTPQRALVAAYRLTELLPESGHLLHMPCHIFILCGYYDEAIKTNSKAIAADRAYVKEFGMGGEYPLHYLKHNLYILVRSYMLSEQYEKAMQASDELDQFLTPYYKSMPHLNLFMVVPMEVNLYFHRWNELLAAKPPATDNAFVQAYWHFSRAMASVNLGEQESYEKEKKSMLEAKQQIKPEETVANNPAVQVIDLAELLLNAAVAHSKKDDAAGEEDLKKAVDIQDRFNYDEPPSWYAPLRIQLGKALLEQKRYKEAEEVFKKGLSEMQRNGRLLYGLLLSVQGQNRTWDSFWVEREANAALRNAAEPMTLDGL